MLSWISFYRSWVGGTWYKLYFPCHYLHNPYTIWSQDKTLMEFPFNAQVLETEYYDN